MDREALKEYIDSKQYFKDAREWYNIKYLSPITDRVWSFYLLGLAAMLMSGIIIDIYLILPITQRITYPIKVVANINEGETYAKILQVTNEKGPNAPMEFVAKSFLQGYLENRENYAYNNLSKQIKYIQASSTRLVFKRYYNYMSTSNPDSPIMRYQQYAKRQIKVKDIKFISDKEAYVSFMSLGKDKDGQYFENAMWGAKIGYKMDEVGAKKPGGSRFNFTVTDYKLKLERNLS